MSRRGSWGKSSEISFRHRDSFTDRQRHSEQERHRGEDEQAGDPCARGEWCSAATSQRAADGSRVRVPARSPRPFCDACRGRIGASLSEFPEIWDRLGQEIGEPSSRHGAAVRSLPGPRLPGAKLGQVDALMRELAETCVSWHERVAAVASLAPPDTLATRSSQGKALRRAVAVLGAHLDALLALPAEPMARTERGMVVLKDLSGTDAGEEILRLHYRARGILGETRKQPEALEGVPCRECGDMALERAEPPSDPKVAEMHSVCAGCGHLMDGETYAAWAKWYARWADSTAPAPCRRCQAGRHGECAWAACPCRASGHAAA